MWVYYLWTKEHEAAQGRQHKDPRKENGHPQPFGDQADISPEFCRAVKDINKSLRILFLRKNIEEHQSADIYYNTSKLWSVYCFPDSIDKWK
jgi:hypothetical protein